MILITTKNIHKNTQESRQELESCMDFSTSQGLFFNFDRGRKLEYGVYWSTNLLHIDILMLTHIVIVPYAMTKTL